VVAERMGTIILSALVAHTGWHWMIDRGSQLSQFRFQWPVFTAAMLVTLMHWLMAIVFLAGLLWLVFGVLRRPAGRPSKDLKQASEENNLAAAEDVRT